MKVLSLDPGGTTGYAEGLINDGLMTVVSGQDALRHFDLWALLQLKGPDIIVCESFEFRRHARDNLSLVSCELIGIVKLYWEMTAGCQLQTQTAAQGKGYFTDTKLKSAGVYRMAKPHANDAVRHLLQWFQFGAGFKYNTKGIESGVRTS